MGEALKKLGKGIIWYFLFFPHKVLVSHHLDRCLQESRHEDSHAGVTPCHSLQLEEKEPANRQGRVLGNSLFPSAQEKAEQEPGGASHPNLQSVGQAPLSRLAPSLPDPIPTRAAGFQESMGLMGPHKTGWQQSEAPTAPLLCQLQNWGSGPGESCVSPHGPMRRGKGCSGTQGSCPTHLFAPMVSSSSMSHPPGWRRPLVMQQSPAGSLSLCMWLRLRQQVWSRAQEGRQSHGHPAQEASLISWVSCRAQDEASDCGTPRKAGQGRPAAPQFPTLGTRTQAAVPLCPTIAFVLLLRQKRGKGPPLSPATRDPPGCPPCPPAWLAADVRQQMHPVPSRLEWGWHRRAPANIMAADSTGYS